MKKVIFTAVAMLAFSAGSFAKSREVEVCASIKQELNWDKADVLDPQVCMSVSIKQISAYQGYGATLVDAISLAQDFYYDCLER